MTHVACRLTAKNRDQLRNPTLGNRVLATFLQSQVKWRREWAYLIQICGGDSTRSHRLITSAEAWQLTQSNARYLPTSTSGISVARVSLVQIRSHRVSATSSTGERCDDVNACVVRPAIRPHPASVAWQRSRSSRPQQAQARSRSRPSVMSATAIAHPHTHAQYTTDTGSRKQCTHRVKRRHKVYSHDTIAILWVFCGKTDLPSVLWRCWLGGRKGIRPVKNWAVGCWRGYLSGARCRLAYGPADATATHCLLLQ